MKLLLPRRKAVNLMAKTGHLVNRDRWGLKDQKDPKDPKVILAKRVQKDPKVFKDHRAYRGQKDLRVRRAYRASKV